MIEISEITVTTPRGPVRGVQCAGRLHMVNGREFSPDVVIFHAVATINGQAATAAGRFAKAVRELASVGA